MLPCPPTPPTSWGSPGASLGVWWGPSHHNCHHGPESLAPGEMERQAGQRSLWGRAGARWALQSPHRPRPDFSVGWGQQMTPWLCAVWRLFAISLPGLPAKRPPASGAARQVQLRILTTAACVPRISSRPGRPQSALPVSPTPRLPPLLGAWRIGSSQTQTQEWILVSSTSRAHNGVSDKNNNDREVGREVTPPHLLVCLPERTPLGRAHHCGQCLSPALL